MTEECLNNFFKKNLQIIDSKEIDNESILSLQKYWSIADRLKKNFCNEYERLLDKDKNNKNFLFQMLINQSDAYISTYFDYWVSLLYCTFEGYRKITCISFNEDFIKEMKNYRDSTFHFETFAERKKKIQKLKILSIKHCLYLHQQIGDFIAALLYRRGDVRVNVSFQNPSQRSPKNTNKGINKCKKEDLSVLITYYKRAENFSQTMIPFLNTKESEKHIFLWYATVYIIFEGYQKLGLTDQNIENMLDPKKIDTLKNLRNSVFHYSKKYYNWDLIGQAILDKDLSLWVPELQGAFYAFFKKKWQSFP